MKDPQPTFPPLLTGHRLEEDKVPFNWAKSRAAKGRLGAGDIVWSGKLNALQFAVVLEPDIEAARCHEMLYLMMVAFGDAAGALCPPEISIQYRWPSDILMNGAKIGSVNVELPPGSDQAEPDWMVVGIDVDIKPEQFVMDPGEMQDRTTFWDEGCGEIHRTELLESTSRHMVNWIHTWNEEGFKPVHDTWWQRISDNQQLAGPLQEKRRLIGLDETGNALVDDQGVTRVIETREALSLLSSAT